MVNLFAGLVALAELGRLPGAVVGLTVEGAIGC